MHKLARIVLAAIILFSIVDIAYAQQLTVLIGTVLDTKGNPIEGAIVEAYRGSAYVASTMTLANGYFSLTLPGSGVYEVLIYKRGYEKRSMLVEILRGGSINLGTITLRHALDIVADATYIVTYQGETVNVPFQITNIGAYTEEVTLNVITPKGWEAEVVSSQGLIVKRIMLLPGMVKNYVLKIRLPGNQVGLNNITIEFIYADKHQDFTINIELTPKDWRLVEFAYPEISSFPGSIIKIPFKVINTLGYNCVINLSVTKPKGWITRIESNNQLINSLALSENEEKILNLIIRIPETTPSGTYKITLSATTGDITANSTLTINVEKRYDEILLDTPTPVVDALPGSTVLIPITVTNEGTSPTLVTFSVIGLPSDFIWSLRDENGNIISAIRILPKSSQKAVLTVDIPNTVSPTAVTFVLSADGSNSRDSIELGINIKGKAILEVLTTNWEVETTPGTPCKFSLSVRNSGQIPISELTVQVGYNIPEGIDVKVTPPLVRNLPPGASVTFEITISPSEMLAPGRYYIPIAIVGKSVREERALALNVKSGGETFYVLVSAVILTIAALSLARQLKRGSRK